MDARGTADEIDLPVSSSEYVFKRNIDVLTNGQEQEFKSTQKI